VQTVWGTMRPARMLGMLGASWSWEGLGCGLGMGLGVAYVWGREVAGV
jgi:hypothetical protein